MPNGDNNVLQMAVLVGRGLCGSYGLGVGVGRLNDKMEEYIRYCYHCCAGCEECRGFYTIVRRGL